MPRFQTVVRHARFVYSPYTSDEMLGFGQLLADTIRARIQSGQNINDQAAAPLKPGQGGRRGYNAEQKKTTKELDEQSKRWTELLGKSAKVSGEVFKQDIAEGTKKLEEQAKAVGKLSAEWNKLTAARESQTVAHEKRMIQIGADANDPLGTLAQIQALDKGQIEQRRQAALAFLPSDPLQKMMQQANADKEAANALGELRYQWEEKVAEVRKKADQEQQEMLDKQEKSIEKIAEKLFDTLFTKPKDFGKDLAKTVHQAVLKPVVEGVSGMAANALHPVIYGEDGKGGLAGIFKGMFGGGKSGDPVKVSTDQNTAATIQNSAHVAALTAVLAGAMGVAAPAIAAPAIPGVSLPSISAPAVSIPTRMASPYTGGGGGVVGGGGGAVAAVAGPSFSDLANLPLNHDRIAQTLDMSAPISQSGPNGAYSTAAMASLPMSHDPVAQLLAMAGGGKLTGGGGASSLASRRTARPSSRWSASRSRNSAATSRWRCGRPTFGKW
jgi:vacuolar-type H+-ATPase subunit H